MITSNPWLFNKPEAIFLPEFLILFFPGKYFLKDSEELCEEYEIIGSLEECELAIFTLTELEHYDVSFHGTEFNEDFPKGCYKNFENDQGFWNTHELGAANEYAHPICKYGTVIELSTVSKINV